MLANLVIDVVVIFNIIPVIYGKTIFILSPVKFKITIRSYMPVKLLLLFSTASRFGTRVKIVKYNYT